jgi:hypothetical protein
MCFLICVLSGLPVCFLTSVTLGHGQRATQKAFVDPPLLEAVLIPRAAGRAMPETF